MIEYDKLRDGDILRHSGTDNYTIIHSFNGEWHHTMTHWETFGQPRRTANHKEWLTNKHTEVVGNIYDALGKAIGE